MTNDLIDRVARAIDPHGFEPDNVRNFPDACERWQKDAKHQARAALDAIKAAGFQIVSQADYDGYRNAWALQQVRAGNVSRILGDQRAAVRLAQQQPETDTAVHDSSGCVFDDLGVKPPEAD